VTNVTKISFKAKEYYMYSFYIGGMFWGCLGIISKATQILSSIKTIGVIYLWGTEGL
jgi:hypothetical protein